MADIGKSGRRGVEPEPRRRWCSAALGGEAVTADREHMLQIGKKGGGGCGAPTRLPVERAS
jgi:general stress protein YciG